MKLWCRIGATLYLNEKEVEILLGDDNTKAKDLFKQIIYDNRFRLDGESYVPESSIAAFNEEYNKEYPIDDYDYSY
jgi:hypothetical protein